MQQCCHHQDELICNSVGMQHAYRRLKRARDQEKSRFQSHDVLHSRYLLMNLLGKGGFSEVYKVRRPE